MCLLDNREVRKGWQPLKDSVLAMFTKHGGKVLSGRRWDERRLAYSIRGQQRGTYLLVYFSANTQVLTAIRRDLQFNESLLRFLLVDCEDGSTTDVVLLPLLLGGRRPQVRQPLAKVGEHTAEVLGRIGKR